jgi:pyrroline-5-carboxylate reductase
MTPSHRTVEALFDKLGDLIVLTDEANFASASVITGLMSSHFELQNVVLDWLKTKKVPDAQAALYVRSFFADSALLDSPPAAQDERSMWRPTRPAAA